MDCAEHQLYNAHHAQDTGLLDDGDELVAHGGQDVAHRLGQDHMAHSLPMAHADAARGLHLAAGHRADAGADDLRHISRGVEADGHHAPEHAVEAGIRQLENIAQTVVDDEHLHQHRRGTEHLHICGTKKFGNSLERLDCQIVAGLYAGHTAGRQHEPQHKAHQHAHKCEQQRIAKAVPVHMAVLFPYFQHSLK